MPRRPQRSKGDAPPPLPNRDHLERANFALQASVFLQHLGVTTAGESQASTSASTLGPAFPTPRIDAKGKGKVRAIEPEPTLGPDADFSRLARHEMRAFRKWTVHNLVKLDPPVKASICACNTVLVPGLTASVRVRPSSTHGNVVHTTCNACGSRRTTPAPPAGPSDLDGPVRAARRARKVKRVPFHLRERAEPEDEEEMEVDVNDAPNGAGDGGKGKGKGKGKQQGGKKGKGCNVEASGQEGHVLWRGGERVSGWGVLCESAPSSYTASVGVSLSHEAVPTPTPTTTTTPTPASMPPIAHTAPRPDSTPKPEPKPKVESKARPGRKERAKAHSLTPEELEELENNG